MKEKGLELERLVFFSDAIVAIAITLLVFDLKIPPTKNGHFTFSDLYHSWQKFAAFFLSFFIIAIFWKIHHEFYAFISKIDNTLLWCNIGWLMFIVILPFTSSLVSSYFFDTAAIFVYSINIFIITIFQNMIWDYAALRPEFLKDNITEDVIKNFRIGCNVAMLNALIATCVAFVSPLISFLILFTRLPMFSLSSRFMKRKKRSRQAEGEKDII